MDIILLLLAALVAVAHVAAWVLAGTPYLTGLKNAGWDRKRFLTAMGRKNDYGAALAAGWKKTALVQIGCYLTLLAMLMGDALRNPNGGTVDDLRDVSGFMYLALWAAVLAVAGGAVFVGFLRLPARRERKPIAMDAPMSRAHGALILLASVLLLVEAAMLFLVGPGMASMAVSGGGGAIDSAQGFLIFLAGIAVLLGAMALALQILTLKLLPRLVVAAGWLSRLVGRGE